MKSLLLTIALLAPVKAPQPEPPPSDAVKTTKKLYIVTSDNEQSKMLKRELSGGWYKHVNPKLKEKYDKEQIQCSCTLYDHIREQIDMEIVFRDWKEHPTLNKYPAWKIGKYSKWQYFDDSIFHITSYPLRFVKYQVDLYLLHFRVERWKDRFEDEIWRHRADYMARVRAWMYEDFDNRQEFFLLTYGATRSDVQEVMALGEKYEDFPIEPPRNFPPRPTVKKPFDN